MVENGDVIDVIDVVIYNLADVVNLDVTVVVCLLRNTLPKVVIVMTVNLIRA